MRNVLGSASGIVFGLGLVISGMVNPAKVLNFLDLAGGWDPSLAFLMGVRWWWPTLAIASCGEGPHRC